MTKIVRVVIILYLSAGFSFSAWAKKPTYVGYQKCRGCHRGARRAHVANKWEASKHAQAFEILAEKDRKNPICLQCHTTGYGEMEAGKFLEGVQCEACHGPGSEYKSGKIMNARRYKVQREDQHKLAMEAGLIVPTVATCRRCHRKEPRDFKRLIKD